MNFFTHIFVLIVIFLRNIETVGNPDLLLYGGLETPTPLAVGLIFFIKVNNTSDNDYDVEVTPDECCLNEDDNIDCNYLNILGGCYDYIPSGKSKVLRVVAPLLDIFERNGHCNVFVDSKSNNSPNKRDALKISFDTTIRNNDYNIGRNLKHCINKDEDPFDNCKPVSCDTYYNGKRSYFSRKYKRCVDVPPCVSDDESEYPTVIYNPISNLCNEESINERDLEIVKSLNRNKGKYRKAKDVLIISKFRPNVTEFVNTIDLIDEVISTTAKPIKHIISSSKPVKNCSLQSFWKKYFIDNKWTIIVFAFVITIQCFMICTMFYCLSKTCNCCEDKKVIRKFFNYRQDVSVTTPLIGTSNIDTETDYQYMSETSNNIEQKIKCYKACQKENQNLKTSMSDDILSKCLNRRDWKKFKSEAITEINKDVDIHNTALEIKDIDLSKTEKVGKFCETKVAFEDEIKNTDRDKTVSIVSNAEIFRQESDNIKTNNVASEKEIKCHSYNCFEVPEIKPLKNIRCFKGGQSKNDAPSVSTEKGAQIYFSNDSIDDFLSERGVTYLAGENISKYTFSSDFNEIKQSTSRVSSKTSKNFVRNVLSLLRKKSKLGTCSDPGKNDDTDVKLIHMSKASVYTSSNDSDYIRTLRRNDSRTSF
ncbi:unnamed protein product [Euphydryas editha]|uniref:Uncharacterized protein n=1 Tax=Euphydryas editha TaxID=104508 RepID=A0AAU9UR36_EUPED|nr:unnamed protein product [Euphydryas editha]